MIKERSNGVGERERRMGREHFNFFYFFSSFLSQIYENRTIGFVGTEGKVDLRDESYA